jgi:hypothetical protein
MISNGIDDQLNGSVFYFLRINKDKAITVQNVYNDVCFGLLDASSGKLIDAVEKLVSKIYLPCLSNLEEWGVLKTGIL